MPPTDKSLLRQQTKDKINDMLFKDDLEDSFIFKRTKNEDRSFLQTILLWAKINLQLIKSNIKIKVIH